MNKKKLKNIIIYIIFIILIVTTIVKTHEEHITRKTLKILDNFDSIELLSSDKLIKKYDINNSDCISRGVIFTSDRDSRKINKKNKLLIGYINYLQDKKLLMKCEIYYIKKSDVENAFFNNYNYENIILCKMYGKYFSLNKKLYNEILKHNMIP